MKIDLHMHSTISDGTDTPRQLLELIRKSSLSVFSLTDHDDCLGGELIQTFLRPEDPVFIPGVELSAEIGPQKFHILGYGYDPKSSAISNVICKTHNIRMDKIHDHLDFLCKEYQITFPQEDIEQILRLPNPGKPHIAKLMVKYGYCRTLSEGISEYLDHNHTQFKDIGPEEAIRSILDAHGIPVLAHGIYGDGRQYLSADELEERIRFLKSLGLLGVECYYSRYTEKEQSLTKLLCSRYELLATAGSDYHGGNKNVFLGDTHLSSTHCDERIMHFLSLFL